MHQSIGLARGSVTIVEYCADWPAAFEVEKRNLVAALGEHVSGIEHIGSTSVPGLAAKPIIDMIAAVADLSVYEQLIGPLAELGYEFMPERVFGDRIFFPKGPRENRTHHLSLVVKGSKGWTEPLFFRNYLRANQPPREKYQAAKQALAGRYPDDRAAYTSAKAHIINEILKNA